MEKYYDIPDENSLDSIEGVENLNQNEENSTEISPGVEKMVMEKVKDILHDGIASHNLTFRNFKKEGLEPESIKTNEEALRYLQLMDANINEIFKFGVLGNRYMVDGEISAKSYRESLKKYAKNTSTVDKKPSVFFSIFGRTISDIDEMEEDARFLPSFGDNGIKILFDVPQKESFGEETKNIYPKIKQGEYSVTKADLGGLAVDYLREKYPNIEPNDPRILEVLEEKYKNRELSKADFEKWKYWSTFFTPEGKTKAGESEGFRTPLRIPPRKFEGIAIDAESFKERRLIFKEDLFGSEEIVSDEDLTSENFFQFLEKLKNDEVKNEDRVKNIINMLVNSMEKNNLLVPIYDYDGNLLWPQKMSHEEIVKMKETSE